MFVFTVGRERARRERLAPQTSNSSKHSRERNLGLFRDDSLPRRGRSVLGEHDSPGPPASSLSSNSRFGLRRHRVGAPRDRSVSLVGFTGRVHRVATTFHMGQSPVLRELLRLGSNLFSDVVGRNTQS